MCLIRITDFKIICCALVLSLWTFNLCAKEVIAQGIALKDSISFDLDFSESDYLLISASQWHADYSLELIEKGTAEVIRKVNYPSGYPLDEILLANSNDCRECIVKLKPFETIDTHSPYQVSIEKIHSSDTQQIRLLQALTLAGENRHKADNTELAERNILLEESIASLKLVAESNNKIWKKHALALMANTYDYLYQPDLKVETLSKLHNETSSDISSLRAYVLLEMAHYEADKLKKDKIYKEALQIGIKSNDKRSIALAKNYIGIYLVTNAQFDEAQTLLKEAKNEFIETRQFRFLMLALHNLSWAAQRAGMYSESLAYAAEALLHAKTYNDKESRFFALYNFALTYRQIGERFLSEEFLDKAIEQASQFSNSGSLTQANAFLLEERMSGLVNYGAFEAALDYADKAKQAFAKLGDENNISNTNVIKGHIAYAMQDYNLAEEIITQAIEFDQQNNRTISEGTNLLFLAQLKIAQQQYIKAETFQTKAFNILSKTDHYTGLARAFSQGAELLHYLGANEDAQHLLDQTSAFIEQHSLGKDLAVLAYRKAMIANEIGNHTSALESLEHARELIEENLPKIRQRNLRQTYLALQKNIFELNIKVTLANDSNKALDALVLAETFKARTLSEQINSIQSDDKKPAGELEQQRNDVIEQIKKNATSWHSNSLEDKGHDLLLSATRELSQRLQKIETQIANSQTESLLLPKSVTAKQILSPTNNELIAYYFIGTNNSWLWVITEQNISLYDLPAQRELTSLIYDYLSHTNVPPAERKGATAWQQTAAINALSETVLSPLAQHLENSNIDFITIIPDGPLHGLPFSPLRLPGHSSPIISDYAISYAPSIIINNSLNQKLKNNQRSNIANLLVIADPSEQPNSNLNFANLPYSELEAQTIKELSGNNSTLLLSDKATKSNLLRELANDYSILHFATHGLLNRHEPSLSGLALTATEVGDDQLWLSPEISNTKISADLVVLSACDSSIGKNISGEGLFSLSRAFIEGGANQVIGSLWRVQDQSTSIFFKHFYTSLLQQNVTVAQALKQAQLSIYTDNNNDWSDPYYWAGFQLFGGGANQTYAIAK